MSYVLYKSPEGLDNSDELIPLMEAEGSSEILDESSDAVFTADNLTKTV